MSEHTPSPTLGPDVMTATDFACLELPGRSLLLAPWLPAAGLAMVYASRGVGKTHFALGVASAVADGGEFLGWRADSPEPVLYVDGEMSVHDLRDRLLRIVGTMEHPENLRILASDRLQLGIPDLATSEGQAWLLERIGDTKLLVLDNISTLCSTGSENEAESWTAMQRFLINLRRQGVSVLVVHHAGKSGDQRGTSRREDALDTVIRLDRPSGHDASDGARFNVKFEKARSFYGDDTAGFEARLSPESGLWEVGPRGHPRLAEMVELKETGLNQTAIAEAMGLSKSTVSRAMRGLSAQDH